MYGGFAVQENAKILQRVVPLNITIMFSKSIFFKLTLVLSIGALLSSCEKEEVLPISEVPGEISSYVTVHFPDEEIVQASREFDDLKKVYEVYLTNSFYLEFNRQKEVVEIDGTSALPATVVPVTIQNYVSQNYPNQVVTDWELEDNHQQIELNTGITLEFSMTGSFLRIDN
jgi:hypothetical protein